MLSEYDLIRLEKLQLRLTVPISQCTESDCDCEDHLVENVPENLLVNYTKQVDKLISDYRRLISQTPKALV